MGHILACCVLNVIRLNGKCTTEFEPMFVTQPSAKNTIKCLSVITNGFTDHTLENTTEWKLLIQSLSLDMAKIYCIFWWHVF